MISNEMFSLVLSSSWKPPRVSKLTAKVFELTCSVTN